MFFPTIPISPQTEVSINTVFSPNIFKYGSGTVDRKSRDYRKISNATIDVSVFVTDIMELTNFLHERSGYKPFLFLQDNKKYICPSWTVTYTSGNKGTVAIKMIRYTN